MSRTRSVVTLAAAVMLVAAVPVCLQAAQATDGPTIVVVPSPVVAGEAVQPTGPVVQGEPARTSQPHPTGQPPLGATTQYWGWHQNRYGYPWMPYADNPCTTYLHVPAFVAGTEWVDSGADFTFIRPAQWHIIRQGMGQVGDYYVNLARDRMERPAALIRVRVIGAPCRPYRPSELAAATVRDYVAYCFTPIASQQPVSQGRIQVGSTPFEVFSLTGMLDERDMELVVYVGRVNGRQIVVSLLGDSITANHVLANANRRAVGTILATLNICGAPLVCPPAPVKPCPKPCPSSDPCK